MQFLWLAYADLIARLNAIEMCARAHDNAISEMQTSVQHFRSSDAVEATAPMTDSGHELELLLLRINTIEAQVQASARAKPSLACTPVDKLVLDFEMEARIEERFEKHAKESLRSIHGFLESTIAERTNATLDAITKQLVSLDSSIRRDFCMMIDNINTDPGTLLSH